MTRGAIGQRVETLDTPALLLDLDAVERNLDRLAARFADGPVRVRPHAKTHKSPIVARLQIERGAIGICCAKLGEAEMLAEHGISNLLVTIELVGAAKLRRLVEVARRATVLTVVDSADAARALSEALRQAGLCLDCLIDLNVGQNRTGIEPEDTLSLARVVDQLPGLRLAGLQSYAGNIQHIRDSAERRQVNRRALGRVGEVAQHLRDAGFDMRVISGAGTGTCEFVGDTPALTEVQPGSYVVMDADYGAVGDLPFEHALTVLTSVVSRRSAWATVDAGLKSASTDAGPAKLKSPTDGTYAPAGDEHGKITFDGGNPLVVGDTVELIPSHCDTTINLYDRYHVVRDGRLVDIWPILGRGRTQ